MQQYYFNIEGVNWTIDDYKDEVDILKMHLDAGSDIEINFIEVDFDEDKEGIALIWDALKGRKNEITIRFKGPLNFPTKVIFDFLPQRLHLISFMHDIPPGRVIKYNPLLIADGIKKRQVAEHVMVDLKYFGSEYAENGILKLIDAARTQRLFPSIFVASSIPTHYKDRILELVGAELLDSSPGLFCFDSHDDEGWDENPEWFLYKKGEKTSKFPRDFVFVSDRKHERVSLSNPVSSNMGQPGEWDELINKLVTNPIVTRGASRDINKILERSNKDIGVILALCKYSEEDKMPHRMLVESVKSLEFLFAPAVLYNYITELTIQSNITPEDVVKTCKNLSQLTYLDISDNPRIFSLDLSKLPSSLVELKISRCNLKQLLGQAPATLKKIYVDSNPIESLPRELLLQLDRLYLFNTPMAKKYPAPVEEAIDFSPRQGRIYAGVVRKEWDLFVNKVHAAISRELGLGFDAVMMEKMIYKKYE